MIFQGESPYEITEKINDAFAAHLLPDIADDFFCQPIWKIIDVGNHPALH